MSEWQIITVKNRTCRVTEKKSCAASNYTETICVRQCNLHAEQGAAVATIRQPAIYGRFASARRDKLVPSKRGSVYQSVIWCDAGAHPNLVKECDDVRLFRRCVGLP